MLRRDLELPGDMVLHQLLEKRRFMVGQKIVKPDTAADEDLFDPRQLPQLSQELEIVTVIGLQIFAGGGEETLLVGAGTVGQLLLTGGLAEICRGAADIVNIALEGRIFRHVPRLGQDGFVASRLDDAALVEGQGAEAAAAEAAPVGDQAEFDLLQRRDAP